MKKIALLFALVLVFSCNKKVIELPEISHSNITELEDVSAAYLFYDETKPDSLELNRKNLISTTNWLVNVDKRLTLKQAIPHIKFLQNKKANAGHKNENAKNYFTCHDTSRNNLGFVEFTDVIYHEDLSYKFTPKHSQLYNNKILNIHIKSLEKITIYPTSEETFIESSSNSTLKNDLIATIEKSEEKFQIEISYNENLQFQDYITIKSKILELDLKNVTISNHEFIIDSL
ncbi:hypothetical protein [Seonamhaeicola maritimus]|uniref:Uncharacterized protein n=1 Tax=Seonamhaeicola maritimus TaxID=2591822 RepID=A0A5C7GEJ4_9FLAO|nr:hypothetical protein [Seonamhaeicola maritimus]TXG35108.1 hypothetical protein FUA22_15235 [Seonamhaeicola maritimus]